MYAAQTGCKRRKNNAKHATAAERSFVVLRIANAPISALIAPCVDRAPARPTALDL